MRKVAIYCRVSTDEQARNKEGSITSQIQRLNLKVEEKNRNQRGKWGKVVKTYKDEAYSGKNTNRPQFQQMLADVRHKRIDTVLVTELSRLSRSVTDFLNFIKELEDHGCDFVCLQYDFDTTSPAGKVFMTIIMALAQFERELTAERIRNNFHARALRGLSNGGTPILGYDRDTTRSGGFVINEQEAFIVREAFDFYLEAKGIAEVVNHLNGQGFKNKAWISKTGRANGGKEFTIDALWRILTNYAYIAQREVNKVNKSLEQDSLKEEERYTVVEATWEPIISPETFHKVQEKLQANKKVKHKATHDFIFSGLVTCDECGGPLCGQSGTGRNKKHHYYGHVKKSNCRIQRYSAEGLEKLVKKRLFSLINNQAMNQQFVETLCQQSKDLPRVAQTLLEAKRKEIAKLGAETEKLVNLVAHNPLAQGMDALLVKIRENEENLKRLQGEKERLEEKALLEKEGRAIDPQFIFQGVKKFREDGFRKARLAKKRAVIKEVIKGIRISSQNVLQVDFWTNENQGLKLQDRAREKETLLPLLKLGRPLAASFRQNAARGDAFEKIKLAAQLGTHVLFQCGMNRVGSSSVGDGAPGQI